VYLESSARTNLPYYKKYGFEEKFDIQLQRGPKPLVLHIMVREPVGAGDDGDAVGSKGMEVGKK